MRYKNSNIRKCLNTKTIAQCAAFFLYCLLPLKGICQTGESTVDALVKMGFENVGWTEDGNERLVTGGIILCMGIAAGGLWLQHHIVQEKRKNDEG